MAQMNGNENVTLIQPVTRRLVYHGKTGGDLDGPHFMEQPTFFAPCPDMAATFAEHLAYQQVRSDEDADTIIQSAQITLFPVYLTLKHPALTDALLLTDVASALGIHEKAIPHFIENFEDSEAEERDQVFTYLKAKGYDGAILPRDLMPVCAGGDWEFQTSFVAFYPGRQVVFKTHYQEENECH